jgi:hypothetical protein
MWTSIEPICGADTGTEQKRSGKRVRGTLSVAVQEGSIEELRSSLNWIYIHETRVEARALKRGKARDIQLTNPDPQGVRSRNEVDANEQ